MDTLTPFVPSPVVPPAPVLLPAHHIRWKLIGAIFVIALFAGFEAYYFINKSVPEEVIPVFTPRPTSTVPADWKTYTNTQYGFEFRYPGQWAVNERIENDGLVYTEVVSPTIQEQRNNYGPSKIISPTNIIIYLSSNPSSYLKNQNLEKYVKSLPVYDIKESQFNSYSAWEFKYSGVGENQQSYILEYMENIYQISSETTVSQADYITQLQILSTFKFTSPTSTIPADWKTFSSKYFTLSFKLPTSWEAEEAQNAIKFTPHDAVGQEGYEGPIISLVRYASNFTEQSAMSSFKQTTTQIVNSKMNIDGILFTRLDGIDRAMRTEMALVLFNASALTISYGSGTDIIPDQILSTFKFSK